jgi:hypothetical protein
MDAAEGIAHTTVYMRRFGSLWAVYERIGFSPKRRYRWVEIEAGMDQVIGVAVAAIIATISEFGGAASFEPKSRLLSIEQALTVTIGSARCVCEGVGDPVHVSVTPKDFVGSFCKEIFQIRNKNPGFRVWARTKPLDGGPSKLPTTASVTALIALTG